MTIPKVIGPLAAASLLLLQMLFTTAAKPQSESLKFDGSGWDKLSDDNHLGFVVGYEIGKARIAAISAPAGDYDKMKPREKILDRSVASFPEGTPTANYGQIRDEMTLFYKNYRNTPICFGDAEDVASLALRGAPPSQEELDMLRAEDRAESCD